MIAQDVLAGRAVWSVEPADCLTWLRGLPADCVDLVCCSPPYVDARTYGIDFRLTGQEWVDWMFQVLAECARVCRGLVVCVCEGRTEDRRYDCTPMLLMADLHRAGYHLRKPAVFYRFGIPGSGEPDWWRNDWEPIICLARPGVLPWSDNRATGQPPRWAIGGEMSYRLTDGTRKNQWGGTEASGSNRRKGGDRQSAGRPSHKVRRKAPNGYADGDTAERDSYSNPAIANPGNVIRHSYDVQEVRDLMSSYATRDMDRSDVIRCLVGGGHMGSKLAHENEAPYPETLVTPFVLSYCPPGGIVADPFSGSGTTGAVAVRHGRRFVGCDLRPCQVELASRRISGETPSLFGGAT